MRIRLPERGNRKLRRVLDRANNDAQLKAWWHVSNVNAVARLQINDHSWVHIQVVVNIALKLLRQLTKHGVEPSAVRDYGMTNEDAEVIVVLSALMHCVGMSVHRRGHEDFSLFLSEPKMRELLEGIYDEPERTVVISEVLQAITSHRSDGEPLALEAGILRVADALDMAKGRSRIPFEAGSVSMHSLSAAAIEEVTIEDGDEKPVKIGILMNNSSGLFQVDGLLKAKLRGSGPRAVRRGDRPHRHREREAARLGLPPRRLTTRSQSPAAEERGCYDPARALRDRLMVGRRILVPEVGVRVPVPQLARSRPREGAFVVVRIDNDRDSEFKDFVRIARLACASFATVRRSERHERAAFARSREPCPRDGGQT